MNQQFSDGNSEIEQRIRRRADELTREHQLALWRQTDRLFAVLLGIQWLAAVALALWLSPWAWEGLDRHVHPHVWAATFLGGVISVLPIALTLAHPGRTLTRMVIAIAQMLQSALLIHLSGGRLETHFHIFGSLAILSFYRDWRVLVPATIVVALDHALRGIFLPASVFGVLTASPWRWVEHAGWVIFEDIFLVWACVRGARELAMLATRQAQIEASHERVEAEVARQTERLERVTQELVGTARRAGMAEIATGVLHNVGNVLNSVNVSTAVAVRKVRESEVASLIKAGDMLRSNKDNLAEFLTSDERGRQLPPFLIELAQCLGEEQSSLLSEMESLSAGLEHIKQIVGAQQQHAKNGTLREKVDPASLFEEAIAMDLRSAPGEQPELQRMFQAIPTIALDKHKVLQILINLLSNARKAVETNPQGRRRIVATTRIVSDPAGDRVQFEVTDAGVGIAPEHLTQVFRHGFTTRTDGHGFGLHSAANAAREMGGTLSLASDGAGKGAAFTLDLPLTTLTAAEQMMTRKQVETCPQ